MRSIFASNKYIAHKLNWTNIMKLTNLYILLLALFATSTQISAQSGVETEVPFLYMKAKYLFETDRHEDAVNAFNKVIKMDPSYEDALVLRAASKYGLAAYKGAVLDLEESIAVRGVTPDAVGWLAKSFDKMGETMKAKNTLESALVLDPKNGDLWLLKGEMAEDANNHRLACDCYENAVELGDVKAERKYDKLCDISTKKKKKKTPPFNQGKVEMEETKSDTKDVIRDSDPVGTSDPEVQDEIVDEDPVEEEPEEEKPLLDPNEKEIIRIDGDLTLEIYGENLGHRRILDQPSILILSDEDGEVAVDICVSRNGSVRSAEYNGELSTINTQSLISLAIRKAKEFWFAKGEEKEACGKIIYKIKGS